MFILKIKYFYIVKNIHGNIVFEKILFSKNTNNLEYPKPILSNVL